jgi:serine/threonine protein kinase
MTETPGDPPRCPHRRNYGPPRAAWSCGADKFLKNFPKVPIPFQGRFITKPTEVDGVRKLILFMSICLVISAAAAAVMAKDQLNRQVIVLNNGKIIPVDRVWKAGADLFYENNKEIRFVSLADIKSIEKQTLSQVLKTAGSRLAAYFGGCRETLARMFPANDAPPWVLNPALWLVLISAAAPAMLFMFIRRYRNRPPEKAAPKTAPGLAPKDTAQELPNRADIVRFFLNLYRQQVGADPVAPAEFIQLSGVSSGPNLVYELRVKHGGDWVKRRMTIGPLGEDSGSKSKCYYVIFDQHLVVKIPPKPVRDFEDYVAGIKKEGHIVERLAPKECIIPKVSVILSQVHQPSQLMETPAELLEEKYIAWLRKNPEYQDYLKIKGTFVFFMDLSRYYFLGHIIDGFHDLDETIRAEINSTAELVRYPAKFKERYGDENESVGFEIRDLYHQCEAGIRQLLNRSGKSSAVTDYRIQVWFVAYLGKRDIGETDPGFPPELAAGITAIFVQLFEKFREPVEAYTRAVRSFARRLSLEQNRLPIAGILTNLLDLLAWLGARRVAMRDLKPDNLLVAGDSQNYPAFLRSPADYSLGFIDVETAVYFGKADENKIRQPLLGGTPYYATPSHLFPNSALAACFGDTSRVLHFQDWQAVLVMIYKAVTGELLFDRTAKHFADIKNRVVSAMRQSEALDLQLEEVSRIFWRSAAAEFRAKMKAAESALRFVEADVPTEAKALFTRVLKRDMESIGSTLQKLIDGQSWFSTAGSREQLRKSSHARICQFMEELKAKSQPGHPDADSIRPRMRFLKHIAALKALAERKAQAVSVFEAAPACRMSAYDVLILMFNSVLKAMYREDWKTLAEESPRPAGPADEELSLATTI